MRIIFLDCITTQYNGKTIKEKPVGGIGICTAGLAEALAKQGHDVTVLNNLSALQNGEFDGVKWHNSQSINTKETYDIAIANNDARLFEKAQAKHHVIWLHNRILFEKTLRKGRLWPLLKFRPTAVFLGEKQKNQTSNLHPFREKVIIPHGLSDEYVTPQTSKAIAPLNQAIYCSQAYRGLDEIVGIWIKYIHPKCPEACFKAYIGEEYPQSLIAQRVSQKDLENANIHLMPKVPKSELIEDLKCSRMMLYTGHKDETFCLAAAEASAMGVPIVTYGRGSLSERVQNDKNGYIVDDKNQQAFANAALKLFKEDKVWETMSAFAKNKSPYKSWNEIATLWQKHVFKDLS